MVFKWESGFRSCVSAQVAGQVCEELEKKGELTAKNLVEVSRDKDAPLHKCFTWNDQKAASLYREEEARNLIRHIRLVSEDVSEGIKPIKVFHNIGEFGSQYEDIRTILANPIKKEALLEQALRDMNSFRAKYEGLKELAELNVAIDKIFKEFGTA